MGTVDNGTGKMAVVAVIIDRLAVSDAEAKAWWGKYQGRFARIQPLLGETGSNMEEQWMYNNEGKFVKQFVVVEANPYVNGVGEGGGGDQKTRPEDWNEMGGHCAHGCSSVSFDFVFNNLFLFVYD